VVLVTPTQVQVTTVGETLTAAQATATQLVQIINANSGSGSAVQLLRKATDAYIRKDADHTTSNDDVNAASRTVLMLQNIITLFFAATIKLT
jgi:hypothetical protein